MRMPGFMENSNMLLGLVGAKFETRSVESDAVPGSFTDPCVRVAHVAAKKKVAE